MPETGELNWGQGGPETGRTSCATRKKHPLKQTNTGILLYFSHIFPYSSISLLSQTLFFLECNIQISNLEKMEQKHFLKLPRIRMVLKLGFIYNQELIIRSS